MPWWGWLFSLVATLVAWFAWELRRAPEQPAHRTGDKPWET